MVEDRSQNRRSLQNMNKSQLARPHTGQENAWGVLHGTPTENASVYHTRNRRVMDPIPLNAVRAAAADVAADIAGTAVAAPVADISGGAAADIAADARAAALADAAADVAVVAADARAAALADAVADAAVVAVDARAAALADAAADVAAAVDSAGDLNRRACHVRRHCGFHAPRSARRFWL